MDRTASLAAATLVVAVAILALVAALTFRPAPDPAEDAVPAVLSLQDDVAALRVDVEQLRQLVEESGSVAPTDLAPIERRLDGLESQITAISANVDAINATARTICQLVADSPFTPGTVC
jgi:hypothetical protein